jgi:O-antigen/teichoic acid export membrane protein
MTALTHSDYALLKTTPMDTTILIEERKTPPKASPGVHRIARDVATLVMGSFLAAVFGVLIVFVVPRITTVEDFGYWRIFILYASYVGFFHLGFGEGALLAWAGKPLEDLRRELLPSLKFLIGQHLLLLLPGVIIATILLPPKSCYVATAVLAFALLQNTVVMLQSASQAAREFAPVAIAMAAPVGLFLVFASLAAWGRRLDYRLLIFCYFLAWVIVLAILWVKIHPFRLASTGSAWTVGKRYIAIGWPITLANAAFGLVQSSDRMILSMAVSIHDFAQYSLAASTMMVPVTLIAAIARVFFPHLAATDRKQHPEIYGQVSRLIVMAWSILLPYYFVVDLFVRRFLPNYASILPVAGVLLLGALFLAVIQILHGSVFNLYGKQKHFLLYGILAVAISMGLVAIAVLVFHSFPLVAAMQVTVVGGWWLFNAWRLRPMTGESWRDFAATLLIFTWSAISLRWAFSCSTHCSIRTACYWALTAGPLALLCRDEIRLMLRFIRGVPLRPAQTELALAEANIQRTISQ